MKYSHCCNRSTSWVFILLHIDPSSRRIQRLNLDAVAMVQNFQQDGNGRHCLIYFETRLRHLKEGYIQIRAHFVEQEDKCFLMKYLKEFSSFKEVFLECSTLFKDKMYGYRDVPPIQQQTAWQLSGQRSKWPEADTNHLCREDQRVRSSVGHYT